MQKIIKASKRAFSVSVVTTTIAWSMGAASLLLPLSAQAAAPAAGAVFKATGAAATYYMGSDGKRYIFANEAVYMSWYRDFAGVQTVSSADVLAVPIGGNVKVRAGTKLVQFVAESADKKKFIVVDAKVYAVEPNGVLRHLGSAAVASGLYGAQWERRITPMLETYFGEYTFGTAVDAATTIPGGSLVKTAGSSDIYYVSGSTKQLVSASALLANRWSSGDILTVADVSGLTAGDAVSAAVPALTDAAQKGGAGTGSVAGGNSLAISLDSSSPAGGSIVADSTGGTTSGKVGQRATILKFALTAPAGADVKVTGIKLHRLGVSSDSDFDLLYIFDGMDRIADSTSFASGVATFTNANGIITIPGGGTKVLSVVGDLNNATSSGKTIGFSVSGSDVTSNASGVTGSAVGNLMTVATVSDMGQLQLGNVTPTGNQTVDAGQTNYEVWRFKATSNNQDVKVTKIVITNTGSIVSSDLQNFKLVDGDTQLGSTIASLSNNKLVFDLTGMTGGGWTIKSGQTRQASLRADIVAGTSRTYVFTIQQSTDVIATDVNYSIPTTPATYNDAGTGTNSFNVIGGKDTSSNAISTTIGTGKLVIGVASNSPQGNVPLSGTNVELARFDFTATGEDVKVTSLSVCSIGSDTTDAIKNVKLTFGGAQVGTTVTTLTTDATGACTAGSTGDYTFGNTFIAPAGKTTQLVLAADLNDSTIAAGSTQQVGLKVGSSNASGRVSLSTISTTATQARVLTVRTGAVSVAKNLSLSNFSATTPTGVPSTQGAKIASFVITGGGEASNVTQLTITANAVNLNSYFQNMKLMAGSTQIGTTISSLPTGTAATNSFVPSPAIKVERSQTLVVDVIADIKSGAATGSVTPIIVDAVSATGAETSADTSYSTDVTLQTDYIASSGGLAVDIGPDTPVNANLVMSSTDQTLATFKFSASSTEPVIIQKLIVADVMSDIASPSATGTLRNVRLYDSSAPTTALGTASGFSETSNTSTPVAVFDNLTVLIPKSGTKTFVVKADVTRYNDGAVSSSTHRLRLLDGLTAAKDADYLTSGNQGAVTAYGRDSGTTLSATTASPTLNYVGGSNVTGNYFDVFRTKVTVAIASDAKSGLSTASGEQEVAKFVLTNSANDSEGVFDATVKLVNFNVASTISNTASRAVKVYRDSFSATNLIASTTTVCVQQLATVCNFGNTLFQDGASTLTAPVAAAAGFADITISAGTSRFMIVTVDTSDAATNKTITVNITANNILWADGVTASITKVDNLPLTGKTLSY